jgi:hypothetical protein
MHLRLLRSDSHAQRRELHAGMLAMDDELNTPMGDRSRSTVTLHSVDNNNTNTGISSSSGANGNSDAPNSNVVNDVITALTADNSSAEDDACVDANDDVQSESDNDSTNGGDGDEGDAPQLQEDELVPTKNSPPPTRESDSPTAVLKAARAYAVQQQLQRNSAAGGATAGATVLANQSAAAVAAAAVTATSKLAVKRGGSSRWLASSEGIGNGTNTGVLRSGSLPLAHNSNSSNNSSSSDIVALALRPAVPLQGQLYANDVLPQLHNADALRLDSSGSGSSSRRSSKGSSDDLKLLRHSFDVHSLQAGSSKSNANSSSGRGVRASAASRLKEHKLLGAAR